MTLFDAIPRPVVDLCQRLRDQGHRGWVVGGCVRDTLRGAPAKDWDIATDARPEQVQRMFKRVIPTGIQHGTVTVLLHGEGYEVTTLRGEGAYADGRRPEAVEFLDDIAQDLARRDFTMNAIALEPLDREVIDPFGGREDLKSRTLRAVGEPERRFQEDGLRILRGARFAATLECTIEPDTLAAMSDPRSLDTLRLVSQERIHDEWMKTMRAKQPSIAFEIMERTGVLDICCPELRPTVGRVQPRGLDAWTHALRAMDLLPEDPALRVAALLQHVGEEAEGSATTVDTIMRRLKFSNEDRKRVVDLVTSRVTGYTPAWTDADVRRWLQRVTRARLEDQLLLTIANVEAHPSGDTEREEVAQLARRCRELVTDAVLTPGDLRVRGKDLIQQLDLTPGPIVGELLQALVEITIIAPDDNQPATLFAHARRVVEERSSR